MLPEPENSQSEEVMNLALHPCLYGERGEIGKKTKHCLSDSVSPVWLRTDWPGTDLSKHNFIYSPWSRVYTPIQNSAPLLIASPPTAEKWLYVLSRQTHFYNTRYIINSSRKNGVHHLEVSGLAYIFHMNYKAFLICPTYPFAWKCHSGVLRNSL